MGCGQAATVETSAIKSWSCENCPNGAVDRNTKVCERCFWAHPDRYDHIATEQRRRVDLTWIGDEIKEYEVIARLAKREALSLPECVKKLTRYGLNH